MSDANGMELEKRIPPSYRKVRDWLDGQVASGKLKPGSRIPPERSLAEIVGVSRPSVSRAVARLCSEGILVTEPRSGTYVNRRSGKPARSRDTKIVSVIMPWLDETTVRLLSQPAPPPPGLRRSFWYDRIHVRESMSLQVATGVIQALEEQGITVFARSNNNRDDEIDATNEAIEEQVDGVIAMPAHSSQGLAHYAALAAGGTPIVFMDHYFPDIPADRVVTDNFGAARDATSHLVSLGHKRIAHFTDFYPISSVIDRERGYRAALEEAGIAPDDEIIRSYEITRERRLSLDLPLYHCLSMPNPITAAFCHNEDAVLALLEAAAKMGLRIPGDLDVAGFFDEHIHDALPLPFTRVVQKKGEMGRTAARLLMDRIAGTATDEPRHIELSADLIPGGLTRLHLAI